MLRLDDLQVDSFATTHAGVASLAVANPTVPYSLLGSCYGCPSEYDCQSNVTLCPATGTGSTVA
ncbi:MAG TPA: hypothetical protein VEX86_23335 [Longimicrobium sp.]|nr:hypothetical protein [Longimicrobium sp.]